MRQVDAQATVLPSHQELTAAAALHGDGFWLLSTDRVRGNIRAFREAFLRAGLPEVEIGWSVKTQWLPAAMAAAFSEGAAAEVVSAHEMELALQAGAATASLIFNGVGKSVADVERALALGARVHLDGEDEVQDLIGLATDHPSHQYRVGLRANFELGLGDRGRFGLDAESGQFQTCYQKLSSLPNVAVCGIHLHVSGARRAKQFSQRMARLAGLANEVRAFGGELEYMDIGGGFCGSMPVELAAQMPFAPPSFDEYATAIAGEFLSHWPMSGPRLILEPGVALAADTTWFAAKVLAIKTIGGQRHAITSASAYTVKPMQHAMDMPFVHVPSNPSAVQQVDSSNATVVSGYTCMESDILHRRCTAPLQRGDWLLFPNCGAYTHVLTPRFIRATPATLLLNGSVLRPCMRAERVGDWLGLQVLSK